MDHMPPLPSAAQRIAIARSLSVALYNRSAFALPVDLQWLLLVYLNCFNPASMGMKLSALASRPCHTRKTIQFSRPLNPRDFEDLLPNDEPFFFSFFKAGDILLSAGMEEIDIVIFKYSPEGHLMFDWCLDQKHYNSYSDLQKIVNVYLPFVKFVHERNLL